MTLNSEEAVDAYAAIPTSGDAIHDDEFSLESRGWTVHAEASVPKAAALASLANLQQPDPVASVGYVSHGNLLIVAGARAGAARDCAQRLASDLHVTLLCGENEKSTSPYVTWSGRVAALRGYLGEFVATLADLRADGAPPKASAEAKFDLVLDFSDPPLFAMYDPPQGYFRAPADTAALANVLEELRGAVGTFEKPRYFAYRESLCAHSRSKITGCNACVEICSTQAISPDGDHVSVDPHLCMGCGACATVCPSGAMSYQFPRSADRGAQLKQLLHAYRHAGGKDACILFHNGTDGRQRLVDSTASGPGIPGRMIPVEAWHVASIGLDLLLPAIAFGASQVVVLSGGSESPAYLKALAQQMELGQDILAALGYPGRHFALVEASDGPSAAKQLESLAGGSTVESAASFMLSNDKRTAIEFALEHLLRHAPTPREQIALRAGAPFGEVRVDRDKCTLCMACVGACPESALMDGVDQPLLKFLERNCVQCGLCEKTCPEGAIALQPRLLLTPAVREARLLNETRPFHCVSCDKPFGTQQMVSSMLARLSGHSLFSNPEAQRRLQMCADCRVVDMMSSKGETSVLKL